MQVGEESSTARTVFTATIAAARQRIKAWHALFQRNQCLRNPKGPLRPSLTCLHDTKLVAKSRRHVWYRGLPYLTSAGGKTYRSVLTNLQKTKINYVDPGVIEDEVVGGVANRYRRGVIAGFLAKFRST